LRQVPDIARDKLEPASDHILEPERAWKAGAYDPAISYFQKMPVLGLEIGSAKFALLLVRTPFPKPAQCVNKALSGPIVSVGKSWGGWVISHGSPLLLRVIPKNYQSNYPFRSRNPGTTVFAVSKPMSNSANQNLLHT
jgi:hypothetical protein